MSEFKIGDVLRLKSGSPDLVVLSAGAENVSVAWLNDGVVETMLDKPSVMFSKACADSDVREIHQHFHPAEGHILKAVGNAVVIEPVEHAIARENARVQRELFEKAV